MIAISLWMASWLCGSCVIVDCKQFAGSGGFGAGHGTQLIIHAALINL